MKHSGKPFFNLLKTTCFLLLCCMIFVFFTYLFRPAEKSKRLGLTGFYLEDKESLDIVYIGASSVYRYYNPLTAWKEYGFTSHNYAVANMWAVCIPTAIRDMEKYQSPSVIVIDARPFLKKRTDKTNCTQSTFYLDSLDISVNRLRGVSDLVSTYNIPLSEQYYYYLDLIRYHQNYDVLTNPLNWQMTDNRPDETTPGVYPKDFGGSGRYAPLQKPLWPADKQYAPLSDMQKQLLENVCSLCKQKGYTVLFVVSPYQMTPDELAEFNSMDQFVGSYGFDFLNCSLLMEEMGLDFDLHFYNKKHCNQIGSDLFTSYLSGYVKEHYNLPDHRSDPAYQSWDKDYEQYTPLFEKQRASVLTHWEEAGKTTDDKSF